MTGEHADAVVFVKFGKIARKSEFCVAESRVNDAVNEETGIREVLHKTSIWALDKISSPAPLGHRRELYPLGHTHRRLQF